MTQPEMQTEPGLLEKGVNWFNDNRRAIGVGAGTTAVAAVAIFGPASGEVPLDGCKPPIKVCNPNNPLDDCGSTTTTEFVPGPECSTTTTTENETTTTEEETTTTQTVTTTVPDTTVTSSPPDMPPMTIVISPPVETAPPAEAVPQTPSETP